MERKKNVTKISYIIIYFDASICKENIGQTAKCGNGFMWRQNVSH